LSEYQLTVGRATCIGNRDQRASLLRPSCRPPRLSSSATAKPWRAGPQPAPRTAGRA